MKLLGQLNVVRRMRNLVCFLEGVQDGMETTIYSLLQGLHLKEKSNSLALSSGHGKRT